MENIKEIIAQNLIQLRKKNNLTQNELAEKLNYSDNTISRWEHAEITPSVETLQQIANIYGVPLENLIKENAVEQSEKEKRIDVAKHIATIIICVCQVWFFATIGFFYIQTFVSKVAWILFMWAIPLSCIIAFLLSNRWKNKIPRFIFSSLFVWSLITAIYLQFLTYNIYLLYIVGIPIQVSLCMYYFMKRKDKK